MQDSLTVSNSETAALDALLRPNHLHGLEEARSAAPKLPGVYAWYFDQVPPGVPVEGCHEVAGHVLLYVGIAPKGPREARRSRASGRSGAGSVTTSRATRKAPPSG